MIQDLTISYILNGIEVTLAISGKYSAALPYNLAEAFAKIVKESNVNREIVIQQMQLYLDMEDNVNRCNKANNIKFI